MPKQTYTLICMTFNGEWVLEKEGFETVAAAWKHADDMGSRWFFYPFTFVTTKSCKTIVDGLIQDLNGMRLHTISKLFNEISQLPESENDSPHMFTVRIIDKLYGMERDV